MSIALIAAPSSEPVTLANARTAIGITDAADTSSDTTITRHITEAREWVEKFLQRALITQTWKLRLDQWPANSIIELPFGPVQSVSSVTYTDSAGATQTIDAADYYTDIYSLQPRLMPAYNESWPDARNFPDSIAIQYVCGYGTAGTAVPGPIIHAIYRIIGHWIKFQPALEGGVTITRVPFAVEQMLEPYRLIKVA